MFIAATPALVVCAAKHDASICGSSKTTRHDRMSQISTSHDIDLRDKGVTNLMLMAARGRPQRNRLQPGHGGAGCIHHTS